MGTQEGRLTLNDRLANEILKLGDQAGNWHFAIAAAPTIVDIVWPATETLVPPRDPDKRPVDPVLDVLQLAATPWVIHDIWMGLREVGFPIGTNMEAETSVALHWLIGHALRHGDRWRETAIVELLRLKEEKEAK